MLNPVLLLRFKGAMLGLLTSLGIALWVSIGTLVHNLPYPSPPVSLDGCKNLYMNVTNTTTYVPYVKDLRIDGCVLVPICYIPT